MALKGSFRSKRSKRTANVLKQEDSKSDEMNFSSSDSESVVSVRKDKVRNEFSTKRLRKESECYKIDNDHIYTSVKSSKTLYDSRRRKMSEESDERPVKQKCTSRNAVLARLNRERKKIYVSSLEAENESLQKQNDEMRRKIENNSKTILAMRREILYLKGLLANSKELGQILRALIKTADLPVTSNMVLTTENESRSQTPGKSFLTDPEDNGLEDYQPRIRSVNSGSNFPILDKDINLGSCSDKSLDDFADLEHYPFDFEHDSYDLQPPFLNDDSSLNLIAQDLDLELEEPSRFQDLPKSRDPNIGICLHVNQKRVSVEICSLCNSRGNTSSQEVSPDLA